MSFLDHPFRLPFKITTAEKFNQQLEPKNMQTKVRWVNYFLSGLAHRLRLRFCQLHFEPFHLPTPAGFQVPVFKQETLLRVDA